MVRLGKLIKQISKRVAQFIVVALVTLLLFEGVFRVYLLDFYKSSFEYLNSDFVDKKAEKTLMIVGDSFSSFKEGYPKVLHDSLSGFRVRNISVPGTSVREQYLFGKYHLKKEKPEVLIFQFYVGNDFLGWDHQWNMEEVSLSRNVYWRLSESLLSLTYLNYSFVGLKASVPKIDTAAKADWLKRPFSPNLYSERDKLYFKSEPELVENSAYLKGGRQDDFNQYMKRVFDLFDYAPDDCKIYFLIIPHKAQVSDVYKKESEQIGSVFTKEFRVASSSYPLDIEINNFFASDSRVRVLNAVNLLSLSEVAGNSVFFNNDSHLNEIGQRTLGEFLLKHIKSNGK